MCQAIACCCKCCIILIILTAISLYTAYKAFTPFHPDPHFFDAFNQTSTKKMADVLRKYDVDMDEPMTFMFGYVRIPMINFAVWMDVEGAARSRFHLVKYVCSRKVDLTTGGQWYNPFYRRWTSYLIGLLAPPISEIPLRNMMTRNLKLIKRLFQYCDMNVDIPKLLDVAAMAHFSAGIEWVCQEFEFDQTKSAAYNRVVTGRITPAGARSLHDFLAKLSGGRSRPSTLRQVLRALRDHCPQVQVDKDDGHPQALSLAVFTQDRLAIQLLCSVSNADPNVRHPHTGDTSLMTAVQTHNVAIVKTVFEECDPKLCLRNNDGDTALDLAIDTDVEDYVKKIYDGVLCKRPDDKKKKLLPSRKQKTVIAPTVDSESDFPIATKSSVHDEI